jgi:outer membrane protein OmpA-like peptidoglycan-associated protein
MALANYLAEIKSSGIYRFVFDKSEIPAEQAQTLRLFVGYSEKGPINTPVRVETVTEFKRIFGDVNKKLERYGDFFHRSCIQGLANGPILALNVKNFANNEVNKGLTIDANAAPSEIYYKTEDIYDKSGFWFLDPKLLSTASQVTSSGSAATAANKYMYISSTDSKNCSNTIFIKAYEPKGYDITFKEWYATVMNGEELPEYLEFIADEKLKDYFVKIYVFGGEINATLAATDFYNDYLTVSSGDVVPRTDVKNAFGESVDALDTFAANSKSNCIGVYTGITLPDFVTVNNLPLSIADVFNTDNSKHKMMMYLDTESLYNAANANAVKGYARAFTVTTTTTPGAGEGDPSTTTTTTAASTAFVPKAYYLPGYTYGYAKPEAGSAGGTQYTAQSDTAKLTWQTNILNALKGTATTTGGTTTYTGYKGLRLRLTDRTAIAYHYMIDTFETFVAPQMKAILSNICKLRENAVAICNFPKADSIRTFEDGTYVKNNMIDFAKFCDMSAANRAVVSLPSEDNGASFAFFYTPVKMINPVTGQKYVIPSAALVSNAYMEKYVSRLPYSIVAGPNYGKIVYNNLVGPDYTFSKEDRDELEPYGVNCLVYVPGKGTYINSNQTAKQNPVTALSKAHIRELVIFLQDEVENLLQNYQWEFNTQTLRDKIKAKADVILETCKNNQGIYAYTTQCDEKNNPQEVIDNEMLILDYAIEPARGAGKMVQQLTIYRTGGLTAVTTR